MAVFLKVADMAATRMSSVVRRRKSVDHGHETGVSYPRMRCTSLRLSTMTGHGMMTMLGGITTSTTQITRMRSDPNTWSEIYKSMASQLTVTT